jgi:hypothetical protein
VEVLNTVKKCYLKQDSKTQKFLDQDWIKKIVQPIFNLFLAKKHNVNFIKKWKLVSFYPQFDLGVFSVFRKRWKNLP